MECIRHEISRHTSLMVSCISASSSFSSGVLEYATTSRMSSRPDLTSTPSCPRPSQYRPYERLERNTLRKASAVPSVAWPLTSLMM